MKRNIDSARLSIQKLETRLALAVDFGDAPAPYGVTIAEDGARHEAIGPRLGAVRDTELDGAHSAAADGDGDEDGVSIGVLRIGRLDDSVAVNVQNELVGARLDAWIDFNGDGSWGGPYERIATSRALLPGDNVVNFDVPSSATAGTVVGRFRLSTDGALGPDGFATDGEVEDHAISIAAAPETGVLGREKIISTTTNGTQGVHAADIDGDGDMDSLSASLYDNKIAWHENDGSPADGGWIERTISTTALLAASVFAADVDGDGDLDVVAASISDNKIAWHENDGTPSDGGWTEHLIGVTALSAQQAIAADVDGDGDLDVLSASFLDDEIAWYVNDGSPRDGGWVELSISTSADGAASVDAADVDGDGDMDVLSASQFDDTVAWYANDGSPVDGGWTEHAISTAADGADSVSTADIDGDGDLDVLSASQTDNTVAWHANDGSPVDGGWNAHPISTSASGADSVVAADVDGDGDADVVAAALFGGEVLCFKNDGTPAIGAWSTQSIAASGPRSVFVADVDGDGDLDVLSAVFTDDKVAWYQNLPPATIAGRRIYYNNSAWDGNSSLADAADDGAIATDKTALLPGGTGSLANYTSFNKGITGIMVDVQNLHGTPSAADFAFKTGNVNNTATWTPLAAAPTVTIRHGAGAGGSDRVALTWPDDTIKKTWLQVTVRAASATGLTAADVFYFGNAVGEAGDTTANALINATDEIQARSNPRNIVNPAPITFLYDYNRDKLVNATDQIIARSNTTNIVTALRLIVPTASPGGAPLAAAALLEAGAVADAALVDGDVGDLAIDIHARRRKR